MTDTTTYRREPFCTAGEAAGIVGGACRGDMEALIRSVTADSRQVTEGSLFVALPGENADGHEFLGKAFANGASAVIASFARKDEALAALDAIEAGGDTRGPEKTGSAARPGRCVILVDSPLAALQALARDWRRRMKRLFRIGVTGSSGKTTTKECIGAMLSACYPDGAVAMNPGNLNSDIGLSLAMFGLGPEHRIGVFEMGMNRKGEMDEIVSVYEPDLALITNVGTAHIGILGSREGIASEKKKIFSLFDGKQCGIVWEDDPFKEFLEKGVRGKIAEFGTRTTAGLERFADRGLRGWEIDWRGVRIQFPLPGRHNLLNALAALSVAAELGLDPEKAALGLESVKPLSGRSEIFEGKITLLRDCYNANPDSVEAAIGLCDSVEWAGRRVYVLGSMRELGEAEAAEHRRIGALARDSRADALFFFGLEAIDSFAEAAGEGAGAGSDRIVRAESGRMLFHTNDIDSLKDAVLGYLGQGDLVLVKASRGLALERLADAIIAAGLVSGKGDKDAA